ncbi:hypothetical protein GPECTOR_101g22 [Gonium pectorale]|uniref:Uncharacterized protein n=1 Tax=Gonium pectorale TaxID=33097 RepID=A0A150FZX2_GONPE|nr:hypothetical protein GPECTOR_101g22 [Gonium pectorale]|eukprot:KXZ43121.1 hypothetical protein GPECTOR_101g22 [Gonium pectorale]
MVKPDLTVFNLPSSEPRPSLPSKNYMLKLQIFEACVLPSNTSLDRCIHVPKDKPVSTGSDEDLQASFPPTAPNPPPAPPAPAAPEGDVAPDVTAVMDARRRRRGRFLRTVPHQRALQAADDAGSGDFIEDIAGVVLIDGERYVSHNETVVRWEGASRVEYEYALIQGYVKVEVVPAGSTTVHKWQQMVASDGKPSDDIYLFCTDYIMPSEFVSAVAATGNKIANFSYLGLDVVNGRRAEGRGSEVAAWRGGAARHFKLTIKQPTQDANILPEMPVTATVDYYDAVGTNEPLAFIFDHPYTGRVHIHVHEYHTLTADSTEASPEVFKIPAESECGSSVSVPRLLSPFEVRDVAARAIAEPEAVVSEGARRQMLDQSAERTAIWNSLDHVNGTGEWPAWALEMYGGVRPQQRHQLLEGGPDVRSRSLGTLTWFPNECPHGLTIKIPAGPCEVAFGTSGYDFADDVFFLDTTVTLPAFIAKVEVTFVFK